MRPYSGQEDLAYMAGYIDADGCLGIHKTGGARDNGVGAKIMITSTHEEILLFLKHRMSMYGVSSCLTRSMPQPNPKWRDRFVLLIQRRASVMTLCTILQPYIVLKGKQCQLVIDFLSSTDECEKELFRRQMKILNKRGT